MKKIILIFLGLFLSTSAHANSLKEDHERALLAWLQFRNHRVDSVKILENSIVNKVSSFADNMGEMIFTDTFSKNKESRILKYYHYIIEVNTPTSSFKCNRAVLVTFKSNPNVSRGDTTVSECTL